MGSNQSAGIYQQGAPVTESPSTGGLVPVHGRLKPTHGSPNTVPNLGPELFARPYAGGSPSGGWSFDAYTFKRNGASTGGISFTLAGVAGHTYFIGFDVAGFSGDPFTIVFNGGNIGQIAANGHFEFPAVGGAGGAFNLIPWAGAAGQATITNLTIREVLP